MVGILNSYWGPAYFQGRLPRLLLVSGRVVTNEMPKTQPLKRWTHHGFQVNGRSGADAEDLAKVLAESLGHKRKAHALRLGLQVCIQEEVFFFKLKWGSFKVA